MAAGKLNLQKASGGVTAITGVDGTGNTQLVLPESGNLVSVDTAVTDNAVVRFNGTTGEVQDSGVTINDKNWLNIGGYRDAYLDILASNNSTSENIFRAGILGVTNGFNISKDSIANINYAFNTTNGSNGVEIDGSGNVLIKAGTGALGYGTGAGGTVTQLTSKTTPITLNKPSGRIYTHNAALAAGASATFVVYNSLVVAKDVIVPNGVFSTVDPTNYKIEVSCILDGYFLLKVTNISGGSLSESVAINYTLIKGAVA